MAAGRHLGLVQPNSRNTHDGALGGLKRPVKFHIDLTYCFEDIENSICLTFGLKLPNHAHFLGVL